MKILTLPAIAIAAALATFAAQPALAQIKPASSGNLAFHEPEMRRHRSGLYRPNRPQHHRRHRHRTRFFR